MLRDSHPYSQLRNSIAMLTGQFLGKGTLLISLMMLSRYLPDIQFGMLVFAVAISQILIFFVDFGVSIITNRKFSINPEYIQEIFSTALGLRMLAAAVSYTLLMLVAFLAGYGQQQMIIIALVGFGSAMEAGAELQYAVFRAREKMLFEAISRGTGGIVSLLLVLAVVSLDLGANFAAATYTIRAFSMLIMSIVFLRGFGIRMFPGFSGRNMLKLLSESWPLGVMGLLFVAFQRLDNVFIREFRGVEAVGAYQESYRIVETFVLLITPTLLPGALFPGLCRAFESGWDEAKNKMISIAEIITFIAGAVMIPVFAVGPDILRLIWGENFARGQNPTEVTGAFIVLMAAIPALFWMNFLVASVIAAGKQKTTVPITSIALILSIAGNFILVQRLGIQGSAIVVLSANLIMAILYYRVLGSQFSGTGFCTVWKMMCVTDRGELDRRRSLPLFRNLWKPLLAAAVAIPFIFLLHNQHIILRMAVPFGVYLGVGLKAHRMR